MKTFWRIIKVGLLGVAIWVVVIIAIYLICPCLANAADHAVVSFNNAEHLAALQDSVVGVCDTTYVQVWKQSNYIGSLAPGETVEISMDFSKSDGELVPATITCRRLVGVTVVEKPRQDGVWGEPVTDKYTPIEEYNKLCEQHPPGSPFMIPGEAIIFYEEVRQ